MKKLSSFHLCLLFLKLLEVVPFIHGSSDDTGPYFDTTTPTVIKVQQSTHALLPCKVKQLGNKSVAWIRSRDSHILTVGRYTYSTDQRFEPLHNDNSNEWTLRIRYVQGRDAGLYECRISSEPPLSQFVSLEVIVPQAKILGEPDIYVKTGEPVQLECVITHSQEPPLYIIWRHGTNTISLLDEKHSIKTVKRNATTISTLGIKSTIGADSGNYTCSPSNAKSASVMLHVLNDERPATAIQPDDGQESESQARTTEWGFPYSFFYLLMY